MTKTDLNARTASNDMGECFDNVEREPPTTRLNTQCNRVCSKDHQQGNFLTFSDVVFRDALGVRTFGHFCLSRGPRRQARIGVY
jgi:hypothetical protein